MMKTQTSKIIFQIAVGAVIFASGAGLTLLLTRGDSVFAEQSGSTPDSGVDSRVKELYDDLVTDAKGEETAGAWGDYGATWNRIYSATDVEEVDFSLQQYVTKDDAAAGEYTADEPTWTNTLPLTGGEEVWKDERTGLQWSNRADHFHSNSFALASCDFYSTAPRGDYNGLDADCGDAINHCAELTLDGRSDWYLPSSTEIMQAIVDGMYNQTGVDFTTGENFWSSTEYSGGSSAGWVYPLKWNYPWDSSKTNPFSVRCVARD